MWEVLLVRISASTQTMGSTVTQSGGRRSELGCHSSASEAFALKISGYVVGKLSLFENVSINLNFKTHKGTIL